MKIYTKAGDLGETGLYGGERVRKDAARVEAYGTVDELNAHLGMAVALMSAAPIAHEYAALLVRIQSELFDVGAELATPPDRLASKLGARVTATGQDRVAAIESAIDALEENLEPLRTFILPGGSHIAAALHVARTVARRAERRVVTLSGLEPINPEILKYLNRLSDLLFVFARAINRSAAIPDVAWMKLAPPADGANESAV